MVGRAIQGVGSGASWIAALALVSDLAPPGRRGEAIGFALVATGAGSIAGPALGGVTADLLFFAAPFLIICCVSLALLVNDPPPTTSVSIVRLLLASSPSLPDGALA